MGTGRGLRTRWAAFTPQVIDWLLAGLLAAGTLADAATQPHRRLHPVAIVLLVVLSGSVGWRRHNPWLSSVVAVTAFMAFQLVSDYAGAGALEVAVIAVNFYQLGRRKAGWEGARSSAVVLAYWLLGAAVITYDQAGGSVGSVLGSWALLGALPFTVGRALEGRRALTVELQANTVRLADVQQDRARRAAGEERNRVARELHDVIAHNVSVMVLQAAGARGVAARDVERATEALLVVETAGRDALVELRRIVGVLVHDSATLGESALAGLSQLDALVDRAAAAGLPVEVHVDGELSLLSPALDLVAYRIVQEALTNALKHAGSARALIRLRISGGCLELYVADDGRGVPSDGARGCGSGHGLIGMRERVRLYGGQLHTGPRTDGCGFEVRARIPLDAATPTLSPLPATAVVPSRAVADDGDPRRWSRPLFAAASLIVLEVGVLKADQRQGPLLANALLVASVAVTSGWRRRWPLAFVALVVTVAAIMNAFLTPLDHVPVVAAYFLLVPSYTIAAGQDRGKAAAALAFIIGSTAISELLVRDQPLGHFVGAAITISAAWAAGRAIRDHRLLSAKLRYSASRLALEQEDGTRLTVAGERSRIARELHAIVAHRVAAMVVQAEGARTMLEHDRTRADAAMGNVENLGRQTLAQMRRILGVLRVHDHPAQREPQPGVAQLYALIQRARDARPENRAARGRRPGHAARRRRHRPLPDSRGRLGQRPTPTRTHHRCRVDLWRQRSRATPHRAQPGAERLAYRRHA